MERWEEQVSEHIEALVGLMAKRTIEESDLYQTVMTKNVGHVLAEPVLERHILNRMVEKMEEREDLHEYLYQNLAKTVGVNTQLWIDANEGVIATWADKELSDMHDFLVGREEMETPEVDPLDYAWVYVTGMDSHAYLGLAYADDIGTGRFEVFFPFSEIDRMFEGKSLIETDSEVTISRGGDTERLRFYVEASKLVGVADMIKCNDELYTSVGTDFIEWRTLPPDHAFDFDPAAPDPFDLKSVGFEYLDDEGNFITNGVVSVYINYARSCEL